MQKMRSIKRLLILLSALSLLIACGQKGDLYLPEGNTLMSVEVQA